jgi:hypothetical protein
MILNLSWRSIFSGILVLALIGCTSASLKSRRVTEAGRVHRGVAYFLPEVLIKISADLQTAAPAAAPASTDYYSIQVEQLTVPDPKHMYALSLKPAPYASDHFNLVVNANGFLSSVNASNEDRTGQIIEALAQTAANAFETAGAAAKVPNPLPRHLDYIFDPSDPAEIKKAMAEFKIEGHQLINIECKPLKGLESVPPAPSSTKKEKASPKKQEECPRLTEDKADGVFYRSALPYILSVKPSIVGANNTNIQQVVMLPNRAPIFEIDVRRAPFVAVNTAMTFTNGYLTSLDYTKPSEIEGFVSIPLELSKMALSVPTNLLQLKIDLANKGNELLEAQKKAADDRAALLSAISNLTYTTRIFQEYVRTN